MANDSHRPDPVYPGSSHRFNGAGTLYSQFSCCKRSGTAGDLHPACTEISAKKTYRLEQGSKLISPGVSLWDNKIYRRLFFLYSNHQQVMWRTALVSELASDRYWHASAVFMIFRATPLFFASCKTSSVIGRLP